MNNAVFWLRILLTSDIQTKNVKKYFDMLCFAAHLFYSIFQASGLRERERERERHTDRDRDRYREMCVCVCVCVRP